MSNNGMPRQQMRGSRDDFSRQRDGVRTGGTRFFIFQSLRTVWKSIVSTLFIGKSRSPKPLPAASIFSPRKPVRANGKTGGGQQVPARRRERIHGLIMLRRESLGCRSSVSMRDYSSAAAAETGHD
ncbi:hypothetical protein N7510_001446 [Penicillium lagena]|uniref:uncharacterized protein n=1 Tax=Penicillium lagena TaxID=94218 RepID=UPI00253FF4C3|nr:uncharacterized protein N7510_001446 [Penicillium lagena]KAJ5625137.1 hypothetical protein N7510_001446 [Penicillium lagena]